MTAGRQNINWKARRDELVAFRTAGKTLREIAAHYGANIKSVTAACLRYDVPRYSRHYSEREIAILKDGASRGLSWAQIARKIGRSVASVVVYASKHGITNGRCTPGRMKGLAAARAARGTARGATQDPSTRPRSAQARSAQVSA